MNAMILAAGLGTRLRPYTDHDPKPSLPLASVPMMAYGLYYLEQLGIKKLVINTHHLPEKIKQTANLLTAHKTYKVQFTEEQPQILGSAGGIKHAEPYLNDSEHFLVINGDTILFFNHLDGLKPLLDFHIQKKSLATLLTCDQPGLGEQFGAVLAQDDKVVGFGRNPIPAHVKAQHFTGVQVFSKKIFNYIKSGPSEIFKEVIPSALSHSEKVHAFYNPDILWFETGDEKSYKGVEATCQKMLNANRMGQITPYNQILTRIVDQYGK